LSIELFKCLFLQAIENYFAKDFDNGMMYAFGAWCRCANDVLPSATWCNVSCR